MYKILVLCKDNAIFGPLAKAYFQKLGGEFVEVQCAGVQKNQLDPLVASMLKKEKIEVSELVGHEMSEFKHVNFDYVLTFDGESEEEAHHFSSRSVKYHYNLDKLIPNSFQRQSKEEVFESVRNEIKKIVASFVSDHFI